MRLGKLECEPYFVWNDGGVPRELYFDESNGVVYALTPEQAAERDPRYVPAKAPPVED